MRPMVKLGVGQVVKTEWDGKWWITQVVHVNNSHLYKFLKNQLCSSVFKVDASLVKLVFDADKRTEWIYKRNKVLFK